MIKAVIFDFGGVLAEEGFRNGLKTIAENNGLGPDEFFRTAEDLIHKTGYVTGENNESYFWELLRERTGLTGSDEEYRQEILKRFILREEMIRIVDRLQSSGFLVAVLSDQTNWLDEIDQKTSFLHRFDYVFNSYRLKKSKRDPSIFDDVYTAMGIKPAEGIFIDDNIDNIRNAASRGLKTLHFKDAKSLEEELRDLIPAFR
jgi:putative hydrolase of the HAD superfamily